MLARLQPVPIWLWALLAVALPMGINVILAIVRFHTQADFTFGVNDPDAWLRLLLVRDWISGGSWYSHEVFRSNAPFGGTISPWTRPLDIVIAFFTQLQFGAETTTALIRTALFLPWLWMVLLLLGLFRAVRMLTSAPLAPVTAMALVVTAPTLWNYFGLGNADHHAPLCMLWVWAIGGLIRPTRNRTIGSGLALALMLWISPEALVLVAALYLCFGAAWLWRDPHGEFLPTLTTTVALGTLCAVMIERPPAQWLEPLYDSISIVHVFVLSLTALLAWALVLAPRHLKTSLPRRALFAKVGLAVVVSLVMIYYPLFFHGPMVEAGAYIHRHFLPQISEARGLFTHRPLYVLAQLIQPVAAILLSAAWFYHQRDRESRRTMLGLIFLLLVTFTLYIFQQRWFYYFYPLAILALAPAISALMMPEHASVRTSWPARALNRLPLPTQTCIRLPLLMLVFVLPLTLMLIAHPKPTTISKRIDQCYANARQYIRSGQLDTLGKGKPLIILAPTDLGIDILFWSRHRIVASNYHRESSGIRYVWESGNIRTPQALRRYLARRHVDALLICPQKNAAGDSILQQLQRGERQLSWLSAIPVNAYTKNTEKPGIFLVNP